MPSEVSRSTLPAVEVFQEECQVHEVSKSRLLELHQDINIAGFLFFAPYKGSEDADAADGEALLDLLLVTAKYIHGFQADASIMIQSDLFGHKTDRQGLLQLAHAKYHERSLLMLI